MNDCVNCFEEVRATLSECQKEHADKMLLEAAGKGSTLDIRIAMENGADISTAVTKDERMDAVCLAALNGKPLAIKFMVREYGASVHGKDKHGNSALHLAFKCSDGEKASRCIKLLLKAGANPEVRNSAGGSAADIDEKKILT